MLLPAIIDRGVAVSVANDGEGAVDVPLAPEAVYRASPELSNDRGTITHLQLDIALCQTIIKTEVKINR